MGLPRPRSAAFYPSRSPACSVLTAGLASSLPAKAMTRGSGGLFSCRSSSTSSLAASTCTARRSLAVVVWLKSITVPGASVVSPASIGVIASWLKPHKLFLVVQGYAGGVAGGVGGRDGSTNRSEDARQQGPILSVKQHGSRAHATPVRPASLGWRRWTRLTHRPSA